MKLRIRDNTLRLRLSVGEVAQASEAGLVKAAIRFPGGGRLEYVVESTPASVAPSAMFDEGRVLVRLPESAVREWADSEQVSIRAEQPLDDGSVLTILVEKDFACLSPREGEDESDMFDHPEAGSRQC